MGQQDTATVRGLFDDLTQVSRKGSTYDGWLSSSFANSGQGREKPNSDDPFVSNESTLERPLTRAERLSIDRIF